MDVQLHGVNSHFAEGISQVHFSCDSVTVNSITVTSETEMLCNITIADDAEYEVCNITINTNSETAYKSEAFVVYPQAVSADDCAQLSVTPQSITPGRVWPRLAVVRLAGVAGPFADAPVIAPAETGLTVLYSVAGRDRDLYLLLLVGAGVAAGNYVVMVETADGSCAEAFLTISGG